MPKTIRLIANRPLIHLALSRLDLFPRQPVCGQQFGLAGAARRVDPVCGNLRHAWHEGVNWQKKLGNKVYCSTFRHLTAASRHFLQFRRGQLRQLTSLFTAKYAVIMVAGCGDYVLYSPHEVR